LPSFQVYPGPPVKWVVRLQILFMKLPDVEEKEVHLTEPWMEKIEKALRLGSEILAKEYAQNGTFTVRLPGTF
ncbi:MAG: hypothetical protein N2Z84_05785, partial [Atribacterota bacterium]|nr:hypothetical protein [Atribacterota bacterium]